MTSSLGRCQGLMLLSFASAPCLWTSSALASEAREPSFSASAHALYAGMPSESDALNPYGPGLGVRAGVTLPISLYLGISFEYFFGGDAVEWSTIDSVRAEANADQVTSWAGYELKLEALNFRPRVGIGYARARTERVVTSWMPGSEVTGAAEPERSQTSREAFVVCPAVELAFPVGMASFILEGRYTFLPEALAAGDVSMIGVGFGMDF